MAKLRTPAARLLLVAAVVILLAVGNMVRNTGAGGGVEVEVESLGRGDLSLAVQARGVVEAADPLDLRAGFTGRLLRVPFQEGDVIAAGDLLAVYDAGTLEVDRDRLTRDLAQAEANLEDMLRRREENEVLVQAQLEQAEARYRQAFLEVQATADLPPWSVDRARVEARFAEAKAVLAETRARLEAPVVTDGELAAARAGVEAARAALNQTRDQLQQVELPAPLGGVLLKVGPSEGETVSAGQMLFRIADLTVVEVVAEIDEIDIGRVEEGQAVVVTAVAYAGEEFTGRLTWVAPTARREGSVAHFDVRIRVDNPGTRLRPGMSVQVHIEVEQRDQVLVVPLAALTVRDGRSGIFRVEGERAVFVEVETGLTTETHAEVRGGLEESARYVVGPSQALRFLADGDRVRVDAGEGGGP